MNQASFPGCQAQSKVLHRHCGILLSRQTDKVRGLSHHFGDEVIETQQRT